MIFQKNIGFEQRKVNLGIEILRVLLCFWVLAFHSLKKKKINYFLFYVTKKKFYHVPCFSFISFYFSYNIFHDKISIKMKKRLERLLIPYIIWPLIILAIDNISNRKIIISIYQLKIQLILGRQIMVPLWYLFSMIFLSIFFFILSNLFSHHFLFVIQLLSICSYIFQYSGFYQLLDIYKRNIKLPILDTLSIMPLTSLGLNFASLKIVEIFSKKRKLALFFSFLFIYFLFKYDLFIDLGGYKGIIHIFASSCFFIGFYLLPLEKTYYLFQRIIKLFTRYTNGIYCLQPKMIRFVRNKFHSPGTLKSCIIIYLLSYSVSLIGNITLGKTKLKYLFI